MRDFIENLRRKGIRDKGIIMPTVLIMFVLITAMAASTQASTSRTTQSASLSRDLGQAVQLADFAVEDALYQLNEVGGTPPGPTAPRHSKVDANGNGTVDDDDASWQWYADPVVPGPGGYVTTIHAKGSFGGSHREVEAKVGALKANAFKQETGKHVTYLVGPDTVFSHIAIGNNVRVQNGINAVGGAAFLTGGVGATGNLAPVLTPAAGTSATTDVTMMAYGTDAISVAPVGAAKVPAGVELDGGFVADNLATCQPTSVWRASEHGGQVVANGNVGCYAEMIFDVPTVITGAGAFNAFVAGNVTIDQSISGAALNLYAAGNVNLRTELASGTDMDLDQVFIFAPSGTCSTVPFRSTIRPLELTGSLACKTINVAGKLTGVDPVDPLTTTGGGGDAWYLLDRGDRTGTRDS